VLLFYPMGASCRLVALFDWPARQEGAWIISINRPGKGRSSPAASGQDHLETACSDIVACLDHLGVQKARLLFLCAGAPFALGFCARYPQRTQGRLCGCSSWVSPSDCADARFLYKLGASMPTGLLSATASAVAGLWHSLPAVLPVVSMGAGEGLEGLSEEHEAYESDGQSLDSMQEDVGGEGDDAAILVDSAKAWGLDYSDLPQPVVMFHGEDDMTVPIACAEWLHSMLPAASELYRIPKGTHAEVMISGIWPALRVLLAPPEELLVKGHRSHGRGRSRRARA